MSATMEIQMLGHERQVRIADFVEAELDFGAAVGASALLQTDSNEQMVGIEKARLAYDWALQCMRQLTEAQLESRPELSEKLFLLGQFLDRLLV